MKIWGIQVQRFMFRPLRIPQANLAPHPPEIRERGSYTTDGTAVPFFSSEAFSFHLHLAMAKEVW